jgi:hypothetical protein
MSKTGRKYGEITKLVMQQRGKGQFDWRAFVPPLTRHQARLRCLQMWKDGRLIKVKQAGIGRNKPLAKYIVN